MSIEKFKVIEEIKLSYLKHRGNHLEIAKELSLPLDYVKKMVNKFRKQEDRTVSVLIANNLMSHILLGSQSRNTHLMEMLRSLEKTEKPVVSTCCSKPVREEPAVTDGAPTLWRCLGCQAICSTHTPPKSTIYGIKLKLLEQLRDEDVALVDMADKMGYTNKVDAPTTIIHHNPNVLVMGDNVGEKKIAEEYSNLSLMDKERLIEKLRKEIVRLDAQETEPAEIPTGTDSLPQPR
jgi:hypothetical protein